MPRMIPPARPDLTRDEALSMIEANFPMAPMPMPILLGRRGYYRDSMGKAGVQERGIYDDAIALISETDCWTFNANCDPNVYRTGIAVLAPGVWHYKLGIHGITRPKSQQYKALVQAGSVTVIRDKTGPETGWFGINIHRGGRASTSSLGCQTIYPEQWDEFMELVKRELHAAQKNQILYVLTERKNEG